MLSKLKLNLRPMLMVTAILALTMSAQATRIVHDRGEAEFERGGVADLDGCTRTTVTRWASDHDRDELTITRHHGDGREVDGEDGDGRAGDHHSSVPEPGVLLSMGMGVALLGLARFRLK